MSVLITQNGQQPDDPSGEERWQEAQRQQDSLQLQAHPTSGGQKGKRSRIIYVENSSNVSSPFVLYDIATVDELTRAFCDRYPQLCIKEIGLRISPSPGGTMHRVYLTDDIPYENDSLYITVYLRKHPPLNMPQKLNAHP